MPPKNFRLIQFFRLEKQMDLPQRKRNRKYEFDYSAARSYFITICTQNRRLILSRILPVGGDVLDAPPNIEMLPYGETVEKILNQLNEFYEEYAIEEYVIMPNHIHFILFVLENGRSRTSAPTKQHSAVSQFISTLKRFCNKECGDQLFQRSFYDHVIRDGEEHEKIRGYIRENPTKWANDELYVAE